MVGRRLRDKTNGCYGSPSSPGARADDPASAGECLSTAGARRGGPAPPGSSPGHRASAASRKNYIKKPLNAFMLFMKEMRQRVIDECTLKESAAINQILGRKVRGVHTPRRTCRQDQHMMMTVLMMIKNPTLPTEHLLSQMKLL